jgi:hypothetical protein
VAGKGPRAPGQSSERGSATVEFALVLPILLVVCLALVQVGLLLRDQLVLVEAARAGAREAAVDTAEESVREAVGDAANTLDEGRIDISIQRGGGQGEPVAIDLGYEAHVVVPLVAWLFPDAVTLEARAVMRQEVVD